MISAEIYAKRREMRLKRAWKMKKKIVVLTGSRRKDGNSYALADAFVRAAEASGHTVTRFDAGLMNLCGCRVCDRCYSTGKACVIADDFNAIAPAVEEADAVVIVTPICWYAMPAQLAAVFDRFNCFKVGEKDLSGKECALLACCEDEDISTFDGVRFAYERTADLLDWHSVGEVLIPGVLKPGEIRRTDGVARAAALAGKF